MAGRLVRVVSVDPGATGAIAYGDVCPVTFSVTGTSVIDVPLSETCDVWSDVESRKKAPDEVLIMEIIRKIAPDMAILEHQSPRPNKGPGKGGNPKSEWRLSAGYASLRSAFRIYFMDKGAGPAVVPVRPDMWKSAMGMSKDKEDSRSAAIEMFPECADLLKRKKDHNRAEALLILGFFARHVMPKGGDGVSVI